MDQLTTDGIIERLRTLLAPNGRSAGDNIQALIDDIIRTRNKAAFTQQLMKAFGALKKFGASCMLPDVMDAIEAIASLLDAEVFLGPATPAPKVDETKALAIERFLRVTEGARRSKTAGSVSTEIRPGFTRFEIMLPEPHGPLVVDLPTWVYNPDMVGELGRLADATGIAARWIGATPEVSMGPANVVSIAVPRPKYPWECSAKVDDVSVMNAVSFLERESAIHPNKVAVENHTRFAVSYDTAHGGTAFYVDISDIYAQRFATLVNRVPRHSAEVFKVESAQPAASHQCVPDYDQLISTYRAIFAAYLEGEFGELMRGSGRSVQDGKNAWRAAVSRLRGHLGVSDAMVPDIIDGVRGFQKFQERLAAVRQLDLTAILKAQEKAKLLWGEAARVSLRGPDGEEIPIRVGPTYQQPIEPVGRPGDLLSIGPNGVMWRSPTSDGRIDPTIFGAVRPIRI